MRTTGLQPAVIVREGGRSSTPRHLDSVAEGGDYWMPAFAGMTACIDRHSGAMRSSELRCAIAHRRIQRLSREIPDASLRDAPE
jgi:hypothetical protein